MSWLLWREYRQNRWILATHGAVILFVFAGGVAAESLTLVERVSLLSVLLTIGIGCFSFGTWHYLRGTSQR